MPIYLGSITLTFHYVCIGCLMTGSLQNPQVPATRWRATLHNRTSRYPPEASIRFFSVSEAGLGQATR